MCVRVCVLGVQAVVIRSRVDTGCAVYSLVKAQLFVIKEKHDSKGTDQRELSKTETAGRETPGD